VLPVISAPGISKVYSAISNPYYERSCYLNALDCQVRFIKGGVVFEQTELSFGNLIKNKNLVSFNAADSLHRSPSKSFSESNRLDSNGLQSFRKYGTG
jgi:hypothetical protein